MELDGSKLEKSRFVHGARYADTGTKDEDNVAARMALGERI